MLAAGVVSLFVGLGIAFVTTSATNGRITLLAYTPIGLGALNIVLGIVMLVTGSNDEARPDAAP